MPLRCTSECKPDDAILPLIANGGFASQRVKADGADLHMTFEDRDNSTIPERKSAYCDFLGISLPSVDDYIHHRNIKPIQLFALAILTQSRPMTIEEVADYLLSRGWNPATGNPMLSLKKAFAGRLPLVQLPDGTIDLELNSIELRMRLFDIGIRVSRNPQRTCSTNR